MQTTLGIIALILTIYTYSLYIIKMCHRKVKPHLFTFLPSAIVISIVTVAQINNNAGWATWMSGFTALSSIVIVVLSPWYGETKITLFDTFSLVGCFLTLGIWLMTENDLLAVILSCLINTLAFLPTWRKIYHHPDTENSYIYFLSAFRASLSALSVTNFTLVNWLFPAYLIASNLGLGIFRNIRETVKK